MAPLYPISKYRLVHKKAENSEENVINIKSDPKVFRYVAYAAKLLFEGKHRVVYLQGIGQAVSKVIQAVENLRNRITGFHSAYSITNTDFNDEYQPLEEGLTTVIIHRKIFSIRATITLSEGKSLESSVGYMPPAKEVFDESGFRKKVADHFEKTKERNEKISQNIADRKKRKEERGNQEHNKHDESLDKAHHEHKGGKKVYYGERNNRNFSRGYRKDHHKPKHYDHQQDHDGRNNRPKSVRHTNDNWRDRNQSRNDDYERRGNNKGGYRGYGEQDGYHNRERVNENKKFHREERQNRNYDDRVQYKGRDDSGYNRPKPVREYREPRENREYREPRDNREYREQRDNREHREPRDNREYREQRDNREYREPRGEREQREPREPKERREPRESNVRENQDFSDRNNNQSYGRSHKNQEYRGPNRSDSKGRSYLNQSQERRPRDEQPKSDNNFSNRFKPKNLEGGRDYQRSQHSDNRVNQPTGGRFGK